MCVTRRFVCCLRMIVDVLYGTALFSYSCIGAKAERLPNVVDLSQVKSAV